MSLPESQATLKKGDRLVNKYSGATICITGECARGYEAKVIKLGDKQTYKEKHLIIGRSWWNFYDEVKRVGND